MKIYVADATGNRVWVKATLPHPPETYRGGLAVDGVVDGARTTVTLPPEEMVQEEALHEVCDV